MGRLNFALILLALCAATAAPSPRARALETDQFTVPARALPDVGPEVDVYVAATVWDVAQTFNARAAAHEAAARRSPWPWKDYHRGRAARYRDADFLTKRVYDALAGPGLPESRIEQWVRRHDFHAARGAGGRTVFETTLARCVYGDSVLNKPLLLAFLSPTVNLHGSYMGVDKLGHVFQHGYHYYEEYRRAERRGADDARATAAAVKRGVSEEKSFYGELTTGVYSNADLAANLAGLKFYLNLTRPVRVGGETLAPLLLRDRRGNWHFNPDRRPDGQLALLVDDTFNEALNPSRFNGVLRDTVRGRLRRRADKLLVFYDTTPERERERVVELSTWKGEPYGHSGFSRLVTIADNYPPRPVTPADPSAPGEAVTAGARTSASAGSESDGLPSGGTSPPRLSTR
jgi:hypothetical protein